MELARSLLILASFLAVCLAQQCYDAGDKLINKRCFKLVNQKLSFNDARNWCRYSNPVTPSNLASVLDQTTSTWLASYARTSFNVNEGYFWIGLSRPTASSRYQWDDGQPFVYSNFEQQNGGNYVAESITNGRWSTYSADAKLNFVCSYDPANPPTFAPQTFAPTEGTTTEYATTTWEPASTISSDPSRCSPNGKSTYFFGYSNDLAPAVVTQVKNIVVQALTANPRNNVQFADVRFDLKNGQVIYYHDTLQGFSASVDSHLPDPAFALPSIYNETDYFLAISNFLNNTDIPLCGSTIFFLTKRLCPDIYDCYSCKSTLPTLVYQRITTNFIESKNGLDGWYTPPFVTSDYTNGIHVDAGQPSIDDDSSFPQITQKLMDAPYLENLIYGDYIWNALNITNQLMTPLRVPVYTDQSVNVTLVITIDYRDFVFLHSITLRIVDRSTGKTQTLTYYTSDLFSDSDLILRTIQLISGSTSDVYMDYQTGYLGNIQLRMYIDRPVPIKWVDIPKYPDI